MTPSAFMDRARDLDLAIQQQDRKLLLAQARGIDERFVARLVQTRNELALAWGVAWSTKQVSE